MELVGLIDGVLVCFLIYSSSFQVYTTLYKFENKSWTEAFLACKRCGSRLPRISTSGEGLPYKLLDKSLQYSNCFWLGATYDHVDTFTGNPYPSECCEIIGKLDIQTITQCVQCAGQRQYVCEKDSNTTVHIINSPPFLTWANASSVCSRENLHLPINNNTLLLHILNKNGTSQFWTRSIRRLNTNPNPSDDQIPICFCNGSIQFTYCPQQLTTICISAQETTANLAKNATTVSFFPQPTLLLSSCEDGDKQNLIGSGTIIGSIVGSVIAVLIIIVAIVVIRLRSRSKGREDTNSKCHGNSNNLIEGKMLHLPKLTENKNVKTSIPIQSYEKESVTCAVVNKNDDSCRNRDDDLLVIPTNEEQKSTVLYNMQQRPGREEGNEEYDKIGFGKVNRVEQNGPTGNVYDNANFHRESRGVNGGNVYDKADFNHLPSEELSGNVYDKADFNRLPSEELSGNVYDTSNG